MMQFTEQRNDLFSTKINKKGKKETCSSYFIQKSELTFLLSRKHENDNNKKIHRKNQYKTRKTAKKQLIAEKHQEKTEKELNFNS